MTTNRTQSFSARVLLAATAIWLVSVTLCFTRLAAELTHDHAQADEHSGHTHDHTGHSSPHDDGCACESFQAFPAQAADVVSVAAPTGAGLLYCLVQADEFADHSHILVEEAENTGPPGRLSPADLLRRQCLLSHAPPSAA